VPDHRSPEARCPAGPLLQVNALPTRPGVPWIAAYALQRRSLVFWTSVRSPKRSLHMNIKIALLSAACVLALSACGDSSAPQADPAATPPAQPAETAPAQAPADTPAEAPDAAPADAESKAPPAGSKVAVVNGCETEIES